MRFALVEIVDTAPLHFANGQTPLVTRTAKKPWKPSEYQISPRSGTNEGLDIAQLLASKPGTARGPIGALK